ncbi:MAG TPA: hypothetical protein IGS53_12260 [Leptolyngbyaceae cyanobacterium M33_DOE_097]|uniref:Low temperature-induced protein n=1 Tax=Oscillatoriales cyanobacterium SpSt-418 TaxID=2282169 RepID=A0A7C3PH78_9CYAN|nr:hypothetical protein [Leptolyngbyaceae cyanobacterium M33_DOE_097]
MRFINILRPVRVLIVAFICTILFVTNSLPALADTYRSQPTEGEAQLKETYRNSERTLQNPPKDLKEAAKRSNEGLNEVQGDADIDKMEYSEKGVAIKDKIEKALEKVTK